MGVLRKVRPHNANTESKSLRPINVIRGKHRSLTTYIELLRLEDTWFASVNLLKFLVRIHHSPHQLIPRFPTCYLTSHPTIVLSSSKPSVLTSRSKRAPHHNPARQRHRPHPRSRSAILSTRDLQRAASLPLSHPNRGRLQRHWPSRRRRA